MDLIQSGEVIVRLGCFLGVFVLMAGLESLSPCRTRELPRWRRWPSNIGISLVNQVVIRAILPITAIAFASIVEAQGWGLLSLVDFPRWLEMIVAVLFLDLVIYWQHRGFHAMPMLWRLHRMHHADTEFDVSTGIRFHPLSVLLSAVIKLVAIGLLGPAAAAVLVFEILLNATSLFNHSNLKLPTNLDRVLRNFIVTPDMHRVHHSSNPDELNRNFGFNFPWWDHVFRSYRDYPQLSYEQMQIGLKNFRLNNEWHLTKMLTQPFRDDSST